MNLGRIMIAGLFFLTVASVIAGCGSVKVVPSEPIVIKTPAYLLDPVAVPVPVSRERYIEMNDEEQKEALGKLSRALYATIDQLLDNLRKIKQFQEAASKGPRNDQ